MQVHVCACFMLHDVRWSKILITEHGGNGCNGFEILIQQARLFLPSLGQDFIEYEFTESHREF